MRTLYIIGNGFDLWHDLPTSYANFYDYAQRLFDEIDDYHSVGNSSNIPWSDFENDLGTYKWTSFYDVYDGTDYSSESFRLSEVYSLEDELREQGEIHVERIKNHFVKWVSEIDVSVASPKYPFKSNAKYISFNYTGLLEEVYKIPDSLVLHLHGSCSQYDELIFGHGESWEEVPEIDENGDSNRSMFTDAENAAKYPFYCLKKPVDEIIESHLQYFQELSDCTEIVVLGHSINDIDLAYYHKIVQFARAECWVVYCYDKKQEDDCYRQLERCGVSSQRIEIRAYP